MLFSFHSQQTPLHWLEKLLREGQFEESRLPSSLLSHTSLPQYTKQVMCASPQRTQFYPRRKTFRYELLSRAPRPSLIPPNLLVPQHFFLLQAINSSLWEFPDGLVVRILGFHCRSLGSIPGWGTEIPQASWWGKKKKIYIYIYIYIPFTLNILIYSLLPKLTIH